MGFDPSVFGRFDLAALVQPYLKFLFVCLLPSGPMKAGRRWGQQYPQGTKLGSNGIFKCLFDTHTSPPWIPC